jgi:HAMP domain-containing protein
MDGEFPQKSQDEIGILAAALNRMKVSLQMAMEMLNSDTPQ